MTGSEPSDPGDLVRAWWDVWVSGDLDTLDDVVLDRYVRHSSRGTVVRSREEVKRDLAEYRRTIHFTSVHIDDQAVSGDKVWSRVTTKGVNATSEEPVTISWLQVHRVERGRLAEAWLLYVAGVEWPS
jgi:ketosteroid isomerase-like protein